MKRLLIFVLASVIFCESLLTGAVPNIIPADISFCIVDLKFDGTTFKVCEFGESRVSAFKGLDRYFCGKFWHYLKRQFNLPIYYVGRYYMPEKFDEMRARDALAKCGGQVFLSLKLLERDKKFKQLIGARKIDDRSKILNHKAIICTAGMDKQVKDFQKKYPNVLVLDLATVDYVASKIKTVKLLNDNEFRAYCPKFKILKRSNLSDEQAYARYVQDAARSVIKEFDCEYYVIKPASDTMGRGVAIVPKNELGDALMYTLSLCPQIKNKLAAQKRDRITKYWQASKNNTCLVEEFAISKIIRVGDKLYDPTMRLIFVLCHDNYVPKIEIFGGYWKIPNIALNDDTQSDFTIKHKSGTSHETKADIDPSDYRVVTTVFKDFMLRLYSKMLGRPA